MQNTHEKPTNPTDNVQLITKELAMPFDEKEVKFKPQTIKNNRALAIPYVDVRVIQDRLDHVLGVENWQDEFQLLPDGSVMCKLQLKIDGVWITKMDVGSPSEQPDSGDRVKAAVSDALKRAAVKFGVGRYLYRLPQIWADYDSTKRQFASPPRLPDWAIVRKKGATPPPNPTPAPAPKPTTVPVPQVSAPTPEPVAAKAIAPTPSSPTPKPISPTPTPATERPTSSPTAPVATPNPVSPTPSVNSSENPKGNPLPNNGAELHRRLREADNQLFTSGKCQLGALLSFVTQVGVKAGYSADLGTWTGPAIELAVSAVREFKSKIGAAKA